MSKKQKNQWDLTFEEQVQACEDLYKVETSKMDVSDLGDNHASRLADGLVTTVEDCEQMLRSVISPKSTIDSTSSYEKSDNKDLIINEVNLDNNQLPREYTCEIGSTNGIQFCLNDDIDRLVVDDGVSPTTLSIQYLNLTEIDIDDYDPSEQADIINQLFYYIISCKHPFAVMSNEEFDKFISNITEFDTNKFIIISVDYYHLLYFVSDYDRNIFTNIIPEKYNFDTETYIKMCVALSYNAGATHNIFFIEDTEYITKWKNITDKMGRLGEYVSLIENDRKTVHGDNSDYTDDHHYVLDGCYLQTQSRKLLEILTGYDEEDEDDDFDDEDMDIDIKTQSETVNINIDAEINNLEISGAEMIDTSKEPDPITIPEMANDQSNNQSSNMVIPVITKHKEE